MYIEQATINDAEALAALMTRVEQSGTMMANPNERTWTREQVERVIASFQPTTGVLLLAKHAQQPIGYFIIQREKMARTKHRAFIVIGIDAQHRGMGVGTALFEAGIAWAKAQHIHRLELTYIATNHAAGALYKKMGFVEEGIKRDSLYINGQYENEYYMSLLL